MALTAGTPLDQLDSQQVLELQQWLAQLGYDPGPLDGIMGPRTKAAYGRFASSNGGDDPNVVGALMSQVSTTQGDPAVVGTVKTGAEQAAPAAAAPAVPSATATSTAAPAAATPIKLTDSAQEATVREKYPQLSYLLNIPDVRAVLMEAASKGMTTDQLQARLQQTEWWRTTAETTRLWDAKFHLDPAKATAEWDQRTLAVKNEAAKLGVPMDAEGARWVAGRVLREGWSQEQLMQFMGQLVRNNGGANPGLITETEAQIRQMTKSYLGLMDDKTTKELAIRIAEGSSSKDAVTTMLRNEAKSRFHWFSSQIDAGLTPNDLFSSTRQAVGNMLEIDPNLIDLNDQRWSALTAPVQDGNNLRGMNFGEAQNWARARPEWRTTVNANNEASDMSLKLLKALGVLG